MTPEQVRDAAVGAMGPELGRLYYDLRNQLAWLHIKWGEYRELFAHSEERIELLNKTAPAFFSFLERTLFEDVLLHISRLSDPPSTKGDSNLTLHALLRLTRDQALKLELEGLLRDVDAKARFARDRRNRALAHKSLLTYRGEHPQPLAHASRQTVEEALAAMGAVLNHLEQRFLNAREAYEWAIEPLGGVANLVMFLEFGQRAHEERLRNPPS